MTDVAYVYGLIDPRYSCVRYVGKTAKTIEWRVGYHEWVAPREHKYPVQHWICALQKLNLRAESIQLEQTTLGLVDKHEIAWIAYFGRDALLNATDGGTGGAMPFTDEHRAKLGVASARNWADPAYRNNLVTQMHDYWDGNERARAAVSRQATERWADPDYAARKTLQSSEYRARRSEIAKKLAKRQRECNDCSYIGTPMNVANHQRYSGHAGHTDLEATL